MVVTIREKSDKGSTLEGSSLAYKYKTRVEVNVSGKHSSLLKCGKNYVKSFIVQAPGPKLINSFCRNFS